ncbi:MAG TPA: enoyl-CoA hydratase [Porticoccaceae bacterium]|nr:enoyl-CoA hydratase [Porticoccaceae bacterium]
MTDLSKTVLPRTETLVLDREASVLRIWFNRPEARNALSTEMIQELSETLSAVQHDRSIRAIVVRGKGGVFCAGADIKEFKSEMQQADAAEVARSNRVFGHLMTQLNEQPQVVIMLVEGAAIGGGLGLACVADVTLVTSDARFRLSETSLGIPPAQIAPFVTERVGLTHARRLMLTGARFQGDEACLLGVAHAVASDADDLEAQCATILRHISACAPGANAVTKAIVFETLRKPRAEALDFAAAGFAECMLGVEGIEGVAAFVEKRKPFWALSGTKGRPE